MALVTVVTPVYNGEKYLADCIESVLNQTFTDWQYIVVNNCSTDASLAIARKYAQIDSRITVHNGDEFLPVIANFNRAAALARAGSRYLKFVFADDTLFPECLENMVGVAEANPAVQIVSAYKIHGRGPVCEGPPYPEVVASGRDVCRWYFEGRLGVIGSLTDLLIRLPERRDGRPLLDEAFLHADIEFAVRMLKDGAKYGFVHQVLTFVRVHGEAVSQFAHVMGTGLVETLAILSRHGSSFLTAAEHAQIERSYRRQYARFLIRALFKRGPRSIWQFQKEKRRAFGIRIGPDEWIRAALAELTEAVLAPMGVWQRMSKHYARTRAGH